MNRSRLHIITGGACNNNCLFCCDRSPKILPCLPHLVGTGRPHLGMRDFLKISKKIPAIDSIVFTGGEPTLNTQLTSLIAQAKAQGYSQASLQTNGRLLRYKELCTDIAKAGVDEISISIHGSNAAIHDTLTRTPGSFKETLQGIKNICSIKKQYGLTIHANFTLTRMNIKDLPRFIKMIGALGELDLIVLNTLMYAGNAKRFFSQLYVSYPQIAAAAENIRRNKKLRDTVAVQFNSVPPCLLKNHKDCLGRPENPVRIIQNRAKELKRVASKTKRKECRSCTFNYECDGIDTLYAKKIGWAEFPAITKRSNG